MRACHLAAGRSRGFSLVEVLCAIIILAVGVLGLTTALTTALQSTRDAERQTSAAFFAAGVIEELRAEGYFVDGETEGECGDVLPGHRWVQTLSPTGIDGLHEVAVEIESTEEGTRVYELRTLLFEPPLLSTGGDARRARRRSESP